MSEPRDIAEAKIVAETKKVLEVLSHDIESVKRKNAAAGMLKSGNTLIEVVNCCSRAFDSLRDVLITQYSWAATESLMSTQTYVFDLIERSRERIAQLSSSCVSRLRDVGTLTNAPPNAVAECIARIEAKRNQALVDVQLALRAKFVELKHIRIRGIFKALRGWASKLIGFQGKS